MRPLASEGIVRLRQVARAEPGPFRTTTRHATSVRRGRPAPRAPRRRRRDRAGRRCWSTPRRCPPYPPRHRGWRPSGYAPTGVVSSAAGSRRCWLSSIELVAPGVDAPIGSARRLLPLGLGRQPPGLRRHLVEPGGVVVGVVPGDACHRVVRLLELLLPSHAGPSGCPARTKQAQLAAIYCYLG